MHKDSHYSKKIWMKELVGTDLLESGYSALAEYSMLNTPNVRCYAAERISVEEGRWLQSKLGMNLAGRNNPCRRKE